MMRDQMLVSRRAFLSWLAAVSTGTLTAGWRVRPALAQGSAPARRHIRRQASGHSIRHCQFMIDERSYRGPNTANRQEVGSAETAFLGSSQMRWLRRELLASKATRKLISSDMPLGLEVPDANGFEAWANGDGPSLGRELELAELLRFIRDSAIKNVVWITADVHYAAAHYYDPTKAQFTDFNPFWEFVAGPLHAGTFGPNKVDNTFGLQVKFNSLPEGAKPNMPPSAGLQFFGAVKLDDKSDVMTVSLHNLQGERIYTIDLIPEV